MSCGATELPTTEQVEIFQRSLETVIKVDIIIVVRSLFVVSLEGTYFDIHCSSTTTSSTSRQFVDDKVLQIRKDSGPGYKDKQATQFS